jgi:DNA-binding winged helix-turn-helix (wHTH) protein
VRFSFDDYVLDTDTRELRRGPKLISLAPQAFDLLAYLVQTRERVVSRDDLFKFVWSGRVVSESTLTSHINAVRKAVGDTGDAQQLVRTIARKGFRFVGTVIDEQSPSGPVKSTVQASCATCLKEACGGQRTGSALRPSSSMRRQALTFGPIASMGLSTIFSTSRTRSRRASSVQLSGSWSKLRSSVPGASRPRASSLTTITCAEWRSLISEPRRPSTRHCGCSTGRSTSTRISPPPMGRPHGATAGAKLTVGWRTVGGRSLKRGGLAGVPQSWALMTQ